MAGCPFSSPVEYIKEGRQRLNEMAEQAGRDPKEISVLAFGWPEKFRTKEEISELQSAGVDHVTIWLTQSEAGEDAVLAELESLAKEVL